MYRAHALSLVRLAHVMLGDKQAAEDVVQEAFCGLYRRWDQLSDQAKLILRFYLDEIDIPPLRMRLDNGSHEHVPPRGLRPALSRGPRRWLAPVVAAAAVVAVIATATSLTGGQTGQHSDDHRAPGSSKASRPTYPTNLEAGLIGLFLPASGAQYSTGALFGGEYKALESDVASRCMAVYGFRVGTATPAQIAAGDWDLTQFPDLAKIARAGMLPSYSVSQPPAHSKAYNADFNRCFTAAYKLFLPLDHAGGRLGSGFFPIVRQIETSSAVLATLPALRACAAHYGWPGQPYGAADSTISSFGDFVDWVAGHIDGAGSRGASAKQMQALNRYWGPIFVQCAQPTITVQERLQLAQQSTFLRQHRKQLQALLALARREFANAERQASGTTTK